MNAPEVKSVRCIARTDAVLGEGPLWDPRIGKLLFVDIKGARIFIYDPKSRTIETIALSGAFSALGLAAEGGYIAARRDGFARLWLDREPRIEPLIDPEPDIPGNRFNDGKVDPAGGFWAGTMDDSQHDRNAGSWWRLAPDGAVSSLDSSYHVTNGPAFDAARGRVYLTDSGARIVYVAESDGVSLTAKRPFVEFGEGDGYPDGMEVDREGYLWIAFWDGSEVRRFSPDGELAMRIAIPVPRPTSLALVGDRIFVTSARAGLTKRALAAAPESGGLFEIRLDRALDRGAAALFDGA